MEVEAGFFVEFTYLPDSDEIKLDVTIPYNNYFGMAFGGKTMNDVDTVYFETGLTGAVSNKFTDAYSVDFIMPEVDDS